MGQLRRAAGFPLLCNGKGSIVWAFLLYYLEVVLALSLYGTQVTLTVKNRLLIYSW